MNLKVYQLDAFTDKVFSGNPAAVCPLDEWLPDDLLQKIAAENNLSETAFFVAKGDGYEIRWFTPTVEVDLCGHATLASAHILFGNAKSNQEVINFYSPRSGKLTVTRQKDYLSLNFPSDRIEKLALTEELKSTTDKKPIAAYKGKSDYMLVFESEEAIREMTPNLNLIAQLPARGMIVTARGKSQDFVSRFFGPAVGVNEDPVTGSAHTTLTPYWSGELNKKDLTAAQLSARGGQLFCTDLGDRVEIGGNAVLFLQGEIHV